MNDLATLGLQVNTRQVLSAERDLKRFGEEGARTEKTVRRASDLMAASFRSIAGGAAAAAASALGLGQAIRVLKEFESGMSQVAAITGATASEMRDLRDIAKKLGSTTEYSAAQAAGGLRFLGMAGFSAAESIKAIPAVLDLATAASMDLGQAADTSSNIMSAFSIAASDAAEVSDVLAKAASSANTDVSQLGQAMAYAGPVAASLGITMSETAAAIGVMGDAGIQGGRAGTALRASLAALAAPTDQAVEAIKSMGLSLAEVNPETIEFTDIIRSLSEAGLSTADAMTIFGREAGPAVLALVSQSESLSELTQELEGASGAASDMAGIMRDNLQGDVNSLGSALQGLAITLGEAGLTDALRGAIQFLRGAVVVVSELIEIIGRAGDFTKGFLSSMLGLGETAFNTGRSIDNVTLALVDQQGRMADIESLISEHTTLTRSAAEAKLDEARAIRAKIEAMSAEAAQIVEASSAYRSLETEAEVVQQRLESMRQTYMRLSEGSGVFTGEQREAMRFWAVSLGDIRSEQQALLRDAGALSEPYDRVTGIVDAIQASINRARGEQVVLNGATATGITLGERLSVVFGTFDDQLATGVAGSVRLTNVLRVATGAAIGLANALSMAASQLGGVGRAISSLGQMVQSVSPALESVAGGLTGAFSGVGNLVRSVANSSAISAAGDRLSRLGSNLGMLYSSANEAAGASIALNDAMTDLGGGSGGGGGGGGAMGAAAQSARELERAQEDLKKAVEGVNEAVRKQREEWAELARGGLVSILEGDFGSWFDGVRSQGVEAFAEMVDTGLREGFASAMSDLRGSWNQMTTGLGGLFSGGGMASLGQAISGALPFIGMATTALQLLDSFSSTETIGRGLSGTLGGAGGARASDYERERRTSFWGLMSSTSSDYRRNAGLSDLLAGEVRGVQEAIRDMTGAVGLAAGDLSGYVARFKFDTRGLSESEVQERLNRELRAYADVVAAGEMATAAFNRAGESNIDALERMSTAIRAVNPTLEQLGHHAFDVSLAGADAASHLAELMGGLDTFASATQTYFKAFYSDAERTAILTRDLGAQMAALNVAMPQSRAQFRAMVEAVDISTASGRTLYAELIGLAGAFDQVLPAVANVTAAMLALIGSTSGLIGSLIADVTERQRASDRAADLWLRTADTLRGLIAEMRGTAGALVSGAEARRFTEARYQSLLASTVAGDNQAASDLPKAAQAMLEATRATASSRVELARAEARVLSDLQLASGVSDIEGARHQVLAGLLGDQVGLLEDMRDYLDSGGVLEASQLAAFEASLASLGGAIEAVKSITYADISARLDVVLTATDDMAPWMRQALGNAVSGITVDVDYIVRADGLTPDLRWLALAGASEHVKTVEFLAANRMGPELTGLALDRAADIARTVSFTIGSRLPADLTRLALAGSSELTRTVNAALASGVDARALRLALGNVGAYEVAVRAALDPGVSGEVRRIVFADAGTYAVTVQAALSASMDPAARRALLEAQGEVAVNIVGTLGPGTTPAEKLLLLNANTAALRGITVAMAFPTSVTEAERALLLESSTDAIRTITALVNPLRVTPDELLFLRELSETGVVQRALEGTVWTRDMGWTDQALLTQLGLGHGVVQRALAARVELHAMGWTDSAILAQLSAGAGSVRRTVDGKMFAEAGSWTRHALLTQLVEGDGAVRRSVQGKMFAEAGSWTRNNLLAQLAAGDGSVRRSVQGLMFATAGTWARNTLLAQLAAGDGGVRRTVDGQVFANTGTWARNTLLAQLAAGDGGVRRNVDGRMFANTGTWARDAVLSQLAAGEGSIRRILAGEVDVSALTGPQRALLEALASGSAAGTLTLGGTFRFDPSAAFGTALESGFKAPSEQLRGALDQLRGAILANSAATADASVAARVNSIAGGLLTNSDGRTILTDAGIADLASRLGVSQEGSIYATTARIAGLSQTDAISSIARDRTGYQTRQALMGYLDSPGLRVNPAGYVAAYDDTAKFKFGAQEHFERHGLQEILSGSRTLAPNAFDWASIGLNVPGFATGTLSAPGGMAWVGERGPELMDVPRGARVYSAPESRRMVDNREVVAALGRLEAQIDHLRDENAAQARVIAYEAKRSADLAQRSEDIGQPAVRTEDA